MFNILSNSSVGIDITDSSLKLIFLSKKAGTIKLENYGEESLPDGIVIDGEIKNVKKFSEHLSKLTKKIKGSKIGIGEIVVSPPEKNTFTILIEKKQEIQNFKKNKKTKIIPEPIIEEIKEQIPISPEKIYFDWQEACDNKILLTAAHKWIIDNYIFSLKEGGLPPTIIDIKVASLIRAFSEIKKQKCIGSKIIIHIGENYSTLILGNNDVIELSMNIPFSHKIDNKLITDKLKITENKAQQKKKSGDSDKKYKGEIKETLWPNLNEIIENIKKTLLFRQENIKKPAPINKIILCGPGADIKDLDKILTKELKIETILGDPLMNINKNKNLIDKKKVMGFSAAIGMALRGLI